MIRKWFDYIVIKWSGYFDERYYLTTYKDCRLADVDPIMHYVKFGWKEGRNPAGNFDTNFYLETNPDVCSAKINPLLHYIRFGKKEGRSVNTSDLAIGSSSKTKQSQTIGKLLTKNNIDRSLAYIRFYGFRHFAKRVINILFPGKNYENIEKNTKITIHENKISRSPIFNEETIKPIDAKVSVIIPTKNAGKDFEFLLKNLKGQKGLKQIEMVIVDSGSQDDTLQTAKDYGAKIVKIPPGEFSHSYARNLGLENATGNYLLFTVQDALPPSNTWLYELFAILKNNELSAVSCAETPREDADLFYRLISWNHYNFLGVNEGDRIFSLPEKTDYVSLRQNGQLSNVACLISSEVISKYKYRLEYAEDLDLGIRLIKDGHKIAFLGTTRIIHSHNRPAFYFMKRGYVDNLFLSDMFNDFVVPKINIDDFVIDVAFTYQFLNKVIKDKLLNLKFPVPNPIFEYSLREAFDLANSSYYPEELAQQKDEYMDKHFIDYLESLIYPSGFCRGGKKYNGFLINSIMGYLNITFSYLNNTYEQIDYHLAEEIMKCIYKEFAILVGAHLAYCYINRQPNEKNGLEEMHSNLRDGI